MNIIEAAKSGRRMTRRGWSSGDWWADPECEPMQLDREDILADDWTVEPLTITREKLIGAWDVATYKEFNLTKIRDKLIDELGL